MGRLKRFFFYKKQDDFKDCLPPTPNEINDYINNEIDYMSSIDHDDMENLVKGMVNPSDDYSTYYEYLQILGDPSILEDEKKILYDFWKAISIEEISVKSIEKLHKKKKRSAKLEPVTIMTEESKDEEK